MTGRKDPRLERGLLVGPREMVEVKHKGADMQHYIGIKVLSARPMSRGDYNEFRGWTLPADEDGADEGYLTDNGAGHLQWQPKDVFEDAFAPFNAMDFSIALAALKLGKRVARAGWNGKGMWLALVEGPDYNLFVAGSAGHALGCKKLPWIGMKTADDGFVPWLASQTDMLAEDWGLVG